MAVKKSFLATLASDMRIQSTQIHPPIGTNRDFPDLGLRSHLFGEDSPFKESLPPIIPDGNKVKVWMLHDVFRCHYFMGWAPSFGQVWILGPYLTEDMGITDINRRFEKIGIPNIDMQFLIRYYHVIPHIRDQNLMYAIAHNHCVEAYGNDGFEISYWEMELRDLPKAVISDSLEGTETEYQRERLTHVYENEKLMMKCVSEGNYHGAVSALRKLKTQGLEYRTNSTLRDIKNYCIVFNTICRVAAADGNVPPWEIDQCSREKSIQIENATTVKELLVIRERTLKDYCELVRNASAPLYSPLVQQMTDMIEARFAENITLAQIAETVNHSPNYISVKFKQETGKSFSEYLMDYRISYSRRLLEQTSLPISSVAEECGIPDNNYFARVFKNNVGMTPTQYRKKTTH